MKNNSVHLIGEYDYNDVLIVILSQDFVLTGITRKSMVVMASM